MARSRTLNEDVEEEFDDYLYREEAPGLADMVEWLFGTVFYFVTALLTPWTWFRRREGIQMLEGQGEVLQTQQARPPLLWRLLDFSETATSRTGYGAAFVFDMVEMFFARTFEFLAFVLRPWTWFRRQRKPNAVDRTF